MSVLSDHCVKLMNDKEALYPWHMHPCSKPLPFVCRMEGWLHGKCHMRKNTSLKALYIFKQCLDSRTRKGFSKAKCIKNDSYNMGQ